MMANADSKRIDEATGVCHAIESPNPLTIEQPRLNPCGVRQLV
jgi:hypothetical protein